VRKEKCQVRASSGGVTSGETCLAAGSRGAWLENSASAYATGHKDGFATDSWLFSDLCKPDSTVAQASSSPQSEGW
jgi:hypothetical protein